MTQQVSCASLSISTDVFSALQLRLLLAPEHQKTGGGEAYIALGQALPSDVTIYRHLSLGGMGFSLTYDVARPDPVGNGFFAGALPVNIQGDTASCLASAGSYAPGEEPWRDPTQFSLCTLDVGVGATTGHFSVSGVALVLSSVALIGGASWRGLGGAVYVSPTGSLLATNCIFGHNSAGMNGGALYGDIFYNAPSTTSSSDIGSDYNLLVATEDKITAGSPSPGDFANITVVQCVFVANTAAFAGGAVFVQMHFSSYNSTYVNNTLSPTPNSAGGAITGSLSLGMLLLSGNTYISNFAPKAGAVSVGGGLISTGETYASNAAFDGAAIFIWSGVRAQTIRLGNFIGNSATRNPQRQSSTQFNMGSGGAIWSPPGSRISLVNTTFSSNRAQNGGGALHGCAFNVSGCTFVNNAALSDPPFGFASGGGGAVEMVGNLAAAPSGASTFEGSLFVNNTSLTSGGAIRILYGNHAPDAPPSVAIVSTTFSGNNAATNGGAISVEGDLLLQVTRATCAQNAADADGGCLYAAAGARAAQISQSAFTGNSAGNVGGSAYVSGSNLTLVDSNVSASAAVSGAGLYLEQCTTSVSNVLFSQNVAYGFGGAVFLASSSLSSSAVSSTVGINNAATVGAVVFIDSTSNSSYVPPSAAGSNFASNYGSTAATLPASYVLATGSGASSAAAASFKSGVPMDLRLTLYDALNQTVVSWQDLMVDVTCQLQSTGAVAMPCASGSLVGNAHAVYTSSSAAFPTLAVAGAIGTTFTLSVLVASPTIPLFGAAGRAALVNVTVAPCDPFEVFQNMRCSCAPGAFLNGATQLCQNCAEGFFAPSAGATACAQCPPGSYSNAARTACTPCAAGTFLNASSLACQPCSPGSFSPAAGAVACTVNPPGFASSTQTTFASNVTLAGVSASSFGAAQNSTLTATLATALAAPASDIVITAVTSAAPSGRHLLQASAAVAFSVATANATRALSLRSALNATATLAGSLTTALRGSADPVLSAVTGVVAAPPAESSLVLAALPCPAGTFLNGLTQSCDQCAVGLVATSTGSTTCAKCPPRFAWVNSSLCSPCPESSVTSPGNPAQCACESGFYDSLFGASLVEPLCEACPLGGVCTSGFVGAADGWWRETVRSDQLLRCREGACVEETVTGPFSADWSVALALTALQDANASGGGPASSPAPANCVEGRNGPLCALCLPGYALQSGECAPCDPKDAWVNWSAGAQAGLLVGCLLFALVFIAFAFFQPLVPALERSASSATAAAKAGFGRVKRCGRADPSAVQDGQPSAAAGVDNAAIAAARPAARSAVGHSDADQQAVQHRAAGADSSDGAPAGDQGTRTASIPRRHGAAIAAGVGIGAAGALDVADVELSDSDMGGSDADSSEEGAVEEALDFLDWLEETTEKLGKYGKIVVKCVPLSALPAAAGLIALVSRMPPAGAAPAPTVCPISFYQARCSGVGTRRSSRPEHA